MIEWTSRFFGVVARPRTWLNVAYLWLAFPLGLFYFVFLTVGLSLGLSLVVIWVGIPVLLVVVGAWWLFGAFERAQAEYLLGAHVTPSVRAWERHEGVWAKLKGHFVTGATWRDLLYLLTKLPLGIACFVLSVVALTTTTWLLALPVFWYFQAPAANTWVPPLWAALAGAPAGVLAAVLWLHVLNGAAWVCTQWALLVFGAAPPQAPHAGSPPTAAAAALAQAPAQPQPPALAEPAPAQTVVISPPAAAPPGSTVTHPSAPDSWTHETSVENPKNRTLSEGEHNEN